MLLYPKLQSLRFKTNMLIEVCAPVLYALFAGLERLILRNPAYDPRSLLQGVGSTLQALVHQVRRNGLLLSTITP